MSCFKSTKDLHIKTNLVHTLYRVQKNGQMELKKFLEMRRPSERKQCGFLSGRKTWYSMPMDVFTTFNFRVSLFLEILYFKNRKRIWITFKF